jgi:hypothetical protein
MIILQPFSLLYSYAYSFLMSRMREERGANDHTPTLFTAVFLCLFFLMNRMREERWANNHPPTLFTAVFLCLFFLMNRMREERGEMIIPQPFSLLSSYAYSFSRMREEREEERLQGPRPQSSYTSHNPDQTRQSSVQEVRP